MSEVVFMALVFGVGGNEKVINKRDGIHIQFMNWNDFINMMCQNPDPAFVQFCNAFSTTTSAPTTTTSSTTTNDGELPDDTSTTSSPDQTTTTIDDTSTTTSASPLERAHWCSFNNGTYIPLGYTFMYTECTLCQCLQSHAIRCTVLQCMPTYCIDGSTPSPRPGQCCAQCAYENTSTACVVNGISFPHGTILRQTGDDVQCWCQLGGIECRKAAVSLFSSMDLWGEGSAIYVIIVIICVMFLIGTLLCCGCTLLFYYYYQRNQQSVQQVYEQYYNNAGWQPMPDEGQVVDGNVEQKQAEAEQNPTVFEYPTGNSEQYIPPPYAVYNNSYVNDLNGQDQKQT